MSDEIWVLGGTGRTGRDTAARLVAAGASVVLVGRDADRLEKAAADMGAARVIVAGMVEEMATAVRDQRPVVVANTVGPFARTAALLARACLPHTSYVDVGNDFMAAQSVFALHQDAIAADRTLVTGAGFGVLATEAVVIAVCRDRPAPARLRVESVPSVALEAGTMGEALASTIVEGVPAGGRRYAGGRLVRMRVGVSAGRLVLPDGTTVNTGAWPSGDLVVAQRTSGAPDVSATTTEVPTRGGRPAGRSARVSAASAAADAAFRDPPNSGCPLRRPPRTSRALLGTRCGRVGRWRPTRGLAAARRRLRLHRRGDGCGRDQTRGRPRPARRAFACGSSRRGRRLRGRWHTPPAVTAGPA